MNPIRFQVNKKVEASLKEGHPWIFRNQCSSALDALPVGSFVRLVGPQNNFLAIGLYEPYAASAIRVVAFSDVDLSPDYFAHQIRKAFEKRKTSLKQAHTNAYRLLHGEADNFPGLNVDIYNGVAVVVPYLKSWVEHLKDTWPLVTEELGIKEMIFKAPHGGEIVRRCVGADVRRLEEGEKESLRTHESTNVRSYDMEPIWFSEQGHEYPCFPATGLKTGFFLDLRAIRLFLHEHIKPGMRVLNLFANDGVFSAIAAKKGADVFSVERHADSRAHARVLFDKWKLPFDDAHWLVGDVWDFLKEEKSQEFDLIIIDPPSLGSKKGQESVIERAWKKLHGQAARFLKADGALLSISCTDRIPRDKHIEWTKASVGANGRAPLQIRNEWNETFDHPAAPNLPERQYFRAFFFK
ncbi:class I SAM-dependent methyltransferase [bacterium]|nr:class I SAM-dependent methyltransferase [bacterium]